MLNRTVVKFGKFPPGICQMCQLPTTNLCVPSQGVFFAWMTGQFAFCVKLFGAEKIAPLTKISLKKPLRGKNLAWPKNLF